MTTDTQLQLALAKMLPEELGESISGNKIYWIKRAACGLPIPYVLPTEWEHIVRLVEETLTHSQKLEYIRLLHPKEISHSAILDDFEVATASWQQRATAILKVKGVVWRYK